MRDVVRGKEVAEEIQKSGSNKAKVDVLKLELDSLESVRTFASEYLRTYKALNVLVNNAGTLFIFF